MTVLTARHNVQMIFACVLLAAEEAVSLTQLRIFQD